MRYVGALIAAVVMGLCGCGTHPGKVVPAAKEVRVGMYVGEGTDPAPLVKALRQFGFPVRELKLEDINALSCETCDVLYLPGGWYFFEQPAKDAMIAFVKGGGGCVGTCAGAYNVAGHIPIIPGRVLRENIRGRIYIEPQQGEHPILKGAVQPCTRHSGRKWEPVAMTHLGGPMLLPEDKKTIVAAYDFEGEIGNILAAEIGSGRAVALASHPELRMAALPADDPARPETKPLPQGDASLILRNAVLWAAKKEVP
jgi:hypothetical protein